KQGVYGAGPERLPIVAALIKADVKHACRQNSRKRCFGDRPRPAFWTIQLHQGPEGYDGHGQRGIWKIVITWIENQSECGFGRDQGGRSKRRSQREGQYGSGPEIPRSDQFEKGR